MERENLINQIFEENFSKAKTSMLREELLDALIQDYKKNQETLEKLEQN